MAIEERLYTDPHQITPELRAAYEELARAAHRLFVNLEENYPTRWLGRSDVRGDVRAALDAVDAAKRAAP